MRPAAASLMLLASATPLPAQSLAPARTTLGRAIDKELAPCPKPKDGADIVVCGRTSERAALRYRMPLKPDGFDPSASIDSVSRERHRMLDVGATGTGSCSTAGAGGWTGCQSRQWKAGREQYGK